jgi:hypothetical protein
MSTQLIELQGKKEIPMGNHSEYIDKELHLTRFFGGAERGTSLQITITGFANTDYIQLDNQAVQALIRALVDAFPTNT